MSWLKRNTKTERKASVPASTSQGGQAGMDQMVRMLAAAPDDQRTTMLGDRLTVFAEQDEASREHAMTGMLAAALQLPDDDYQKIATARFKALNGFDADTRMTLMKSHAAVVKSLPADQRQREMKAMKQIVFALPEAERGQVMTMMQNLGLMGEAG